MTCDHINRFESLLYRPKIGIFTYSMQIMMLLATPIPFVP